MNALIAFFKKNPHRAGLISAIMAAAIFGLYPSTMKAAYSHGCNAVAMALTTTWARGLGLALYCALNRATLFQTREDIKQAFIGGSFQVVSVFCILLSLIYIPGPIVLIIVFTHTLMLLFFMAWRGEIKLDLLNISTTVMALFGLVMVLDLWNVQSAENWLGIALAFIAAIATVFRIYIYGKQTQCRNAIIVGAESFLVAAALSIPAILFQTPHLPGSLIGNTYVIASCISLTLGSFCMFWGIALLGSFQHSLMAKIEPVFTSIFSVLLLNEILGWHQYAGIALVIGSLATYQVIQQRAKNQAATTCNQPS